MSIVLYRVKRGCGDVRLYGVTRVSVSSGISRNAYYYLRDFEGNVKRDSFCVSIACCKSCNVLTCIGRKRCREALAAKGSVGNNHRSVFSCGISRIELIRFARGINAVGIAELPLILDSGSCRPFVICFNDAISESFVRASAINPYIVVGFKLKRYCISVNVNSTVIRHGIALTTSDARVKSCTRVLLLALVGSNRGRRYLIFGNLNGDSNRFRIVVIGIRSEDRNEGVVACVTNERVLVSAFDRPGTESAFGKSNLVKKFISIGCALLYGDVTDIYVCFIYSYRSSSCCF